MNSNNQKTLKNEWVDAYTAHGFSVFALRPNDKRPLKKEWQNTPYDPFLDPASFKHGFGVVLTEEDLVLDIDPRNFKSGENPYVELKKLIGISDLERRTFVVRSGSGRGFHVYLKKPKGVSIHKSIKAFKGIDFLSKGCYVVGVGSPHPDTKNPYEAVNGTLHTVIDAPQGLLNIIEKTQTPILEGTNEFIEDIGTINRFIEFCKEYTPAIQGESGDEHTFKLACFGRDFGLSLKTTYNVMLEHFNPKCEPIWEDKELLDKVSHAYRYATGEIGSAHPKAAFKQIEIEDDDIRWDVDSNGVMRKTLNNCVNYMLVNDFGIKGLLAYNAFSKDIIFTRPAPWHKKGENVTTWRDDDTVHLKMFMSTRPSHRCEFSAQIVNEAVVEAAKYQYFHPVKDYLESLKWDGMERLDNWLITYCGAEGLNEDYVRAIGAKTLIAGIKRIYEPGSKHDQMLILEGKQDLGKSTVCRILGGKWFGEVNSNNIANKDVIDIMRGKWIIEIPELVATTRSETKMVKAFLSCQSDRVRLAYGRFAQDFPRQSIFIGTHNPEADNLYLKDKTGNRRFWPVEVHKIDMAGLALDRDQLWAEALVRYRKKENTYLVDKRIRAIAENVQRARVPGDPWRDMVEIWLDNDEFGNSRNVVTGAEVWTHCIGGLEREYDRMKQIRITGLMVDELGWEQGVFYHPGHGRGVRGFRRVEEVSREQQISDSLDEL